MRAFRWMIVAVLVFVAVAVASHVIGAQSVADIRLPGAGRVIDASLYPSLQAAIDALPAAGGAVRLPPGTFEIKEPLRIGVGDVLIEGAGTATHIKNVNTEGASAIVVRHPSGDDSRNAELWRVRLADFRLTGNDKSGHGIEARRINEIFIEGVTVSYHGGDGIHLHQCYEDPRINDSLITYNKKSGLYAVGCHDVVVAANQFEENLDAVRFIDGFNLCMTGNNL
ncbi:MAG: right-handed parallel beta-helix repeat-containing protein, partial [Sedimentisphaerales bacterium]|nr:right-handed parallel beta-helix repeat-containing protein [Sedimentisphaerales bacterium]